MKKSIIFLCGGYRSVYPGNFIPSLLEIENKSAQIFRFIYVFQNGVENRKWCKDLINKGHIVETMDFDRNLFERIYQISLIVKKYDVKIIHTHFGDKFAATLYGLFKRIIVIWHIHFDYTYSISKKNMIKRLFHIIKEYLGFNIIGYKAIKIFVTKSMAEKNNGIYIRNGMVLARAEKFNEAKRSEYRKSLGFLEKDKVILLFGWSLDIKGVDIAYDAVKKCYHSHDNIKLAVVCGPDKKIVINYLREKCDYNQKDDFLYLLPPIQDVFIYHNIADIFLSSSRTEGFSYGLLEALSIGKPCIVSDISGTIWAREFNNTVFFSNGQSDSLSDAIKTTIHRIETGDLSSVEDIRLAEKKYNAEIMAERIAYIYKRALEERYGSL